MLYRETNIAAALVWAILLACTQRVAAEINGTESIEYMSLTSDLVIRARLGPTMTPVSDYRANWQRVSLNVTETLKGRPTSELVVAFYGARDQSDIEDWRQRGGERIIFLHCGDGLPETAGPRPPAGTYVAREQDWMLPGTRRLRSGARIHS